MDPLFDPGWAEIISKCSTYSGYALIGVFFVSFVWTCASLGGMAAKATEIDEAEEKNKVKKDAP